MSYFEELWSAGKEEENIFAKIPSTSNEEADIFSILDTDPKTSQIHTQQPSKVNTQEEVFFTPQNISSAPIFETTEPEPMIAPVVEESTGGNLKVLGIGGAGCNAINRMIEDDVKGVDFIAINTDAQVLKKSLTKKRVTIGYKITKGLGAGAKPEIGEKAAIESSEEIRDLLQDTDMVFITAGMGGGTGTGAAPVIAQVAKESGCLVVAVVTLPFSFEGTKRYKAAIEGIDKLRNHVDTMLVISNSRIFEIVEKNTSVKDAFKKIDEVLKQAVQGISGIISETAIINVDFNDVKTILSNKGEAIMGIGQAKGDGRALKAAQEALANPLIENNTFRQSGAMVAKIIGGSDFDMKEFHEAAEAISQFCRPDAEIIMGLDFDETLRDQVRIIIVATDLIRHLSEEQITASKNREQDMMMQQPNPMFSTIEDLQNMHHQQMNLPLDKELPNHMEQNYLDLDEDWGIKPSTKHVNNSYEDRYRDRNSNSSISQQFHQQAPHTFGDRRSIDFSMRKEDPNIYNELDPSEARRSVSGVPAMGVDLDTPAFLRRRKKIHNNSEF